MKKLLRELRLCYRTNGRHSLPWRKTKNPYKILVSELMLQQTQVERVVPLYKKFITQFPTPEVLAQAPLKKVLAAWQGLGYNRRAKFLHQAAKAIAEKGWPDDLEVLPGVGHYTARAVAAFAFNTPEVFVETNIRTVFIHHLYAGRSSVSDGELLLKVAEALKKSKMQPREFYAALMDYGSHLKKRGVKLNSRSAHYATQSKFEGSARQLRGAILRELLKRPATLPALLLRLRSRQTKNLSPKTRREVEPALQALRNEKLITRAGSRYRVAR